MQVEEEDAPVDSQAEDEPSSLNAAPEISDSFNSQFTLRNSFGDFETAAAHRRVASNAASHAHVTAQMVMQFLI